jgi:enamine deaminase RidA (YjgF/YER057c/UK114 family)
MVGRDPSGEVIPGIAAQTTRSLERIEQELAVHGRDRTAIVRLRFYVVDMRWWPEAREIIGEFFGGSVPPSTAVGVTGLADPRMLIEIDAEASVA